VEILVTNIIAGALSTTKWLNVRHAAAGGDRFLEGEGENTAEVAQMTIYEQSFICLKYQSKSDIPICFSL